MSTIHMPPPLARANQTINLTANAVLQISQVAWLICPADVAAVTKKPHTPLTQIPNAPLLVDQPIIAGRTKRLQTMGDHHDT